MTTNKKEKFPCKVEICGKELDTHSELLKHLKNHIGNRQEVKCPYVVCTRIYINVQSFTGHISKKHQNELVREIAGNFYALLMNSNVIGKSITENDNFNNAPLHIGQIGRAHV